MPPRAKKTPKKSPHIPSTLTDLGVLRLPAVLDLLQIGESSLWNGIRRGIYPAPVRLSSRTVAWRVADIRQLLETLTEKS